MLINTEFYILYGMKDDEVYYICNTDPIIWTSVLNEAKVYYNRYNAEYSILREYDNYRNISSLIEKGGLTGFYLGIYNNGNETGRIKLL